jgi:CheY-like chemotaxis protein
MPATLLLADDSVTIQRVIELTFADEDITVVAVGDGDAAIARLNSAPPDIVLADVDMPGRDGYAVAAHVHQTPALSHIPVLLLTGAFDPVDEARARESACAGVLVKPFEPQMVISRVRDLLEHRAPATAGPAPGAQAPSAPADALIAAPVQSPAATRESVDDYFQRLDEAFAHLTVPLNDADQPIDGRPAPPPALASFAQAETGTTPTAALPAPPAVETSPEAPGLDASAGPLSIADAFGALLGMERGEAPPVLPEAWLPVPSEEVVEQIARRVSEEVTERVVRQLAPDIVSRVAERLVREELERLKGLQS